MINISYIKWNELFIWQFSYFYSSKYSIKFTDVKNILLNVVDNWSNMSNQEFSVTGYQLVETNTRYLKTSESKTTRKKGINFVLRHRYDAAPTDDQVVDCNELISCYIHVYLLLKIISKIILNTNKPCNDKQ